MPTNPPSKPEPIKGGSQSPGRPPTAPDETVRPESEAAPREDDKRIERFRER